MATCRVYSCIHRNLALSPMINNSREGAPVNNGRHHSPAVVVLTATISPDPKMPNLVVRDAKSRLDQYKRSVEWWAKTCSRYGYHLMVVENSGQVEKLAEFRSERVQLLAVAEQTSLEVRQGKGSGEAAMLMQASLALKEHPVILKCTGRLKVLNAADLIRSHLAEPNCETAIPWSSSFRKVDTRCFTANPHFLQTWMAQIQTLVSDEEGCDLESQSARWLLTQIAEGQQIHDTSRTPAIVGSSATQGIKYTERKARLRLSIEYVARAKLRTDPR